MTKNKKALSNRKSSADEVKISRHNEKIMLEEMLSYKPELKKGIKKCKAETKCFTCFLLLCLGAFAAQFTAVSLGLGIMAVFSLFKKFKLRKFKAVYVILKKISRDIGYKGIYNSKDIWEMVEDYEKKYGRDNDEYNCLVYVINEYEKFIFKIEDVLNGLNREQKSEKNKKLIKSADSEKNKNLKKIKTIDFDEKKSDITDKTTAAELLEKDKVAILKKSNNKNTTVYLYKKTASS